MKSRIVDWNKGNFNFQNIDIDALNRVYTTVCADFDFTPGRVSFQLTSDEDLWKMNVEHLDHDTYTDVITFSYSTEKIVSGEIFVSADRAIENANMLNITPEEEILRYAVHGILHLCGMNDADENERLAMRTKEDLYIEKYQLFHVER